MSVRQPLRYRRNCVAKGRFGWWWCMNRLIGLRLAVPLFFLHIVLVQCHSGLSHFASLPPHHELVVVPPRARAVPSSDKDDSDAQGPRDGHIQLMAERGRMGW